MSGGGARASSHEGSLAYDSLTNSASSESMNVLVRSPQGPDLAALERLVVRATGARAVELGERVQALWSGYGEIRRAALSGVGRGRDRADARHRLEPGR